MSALIYFSVETFAYVHLIQSTCIRWFSLFADKKINIAAGLIYSMTIYTVQKPFVIISYEEFGVIIVQVLKQN